VNAKELTLRQLRAELKKLGLSPSGLKTVLISRLKHAWGQDTTASDREDELAISTMISAAALQKDGIHKDGGTGAGTSLSNIIPASSSLYSSKVSKHLSSRLPSKRKPLMRTKVLIHKQPRIRKESVSAPLLIDEEEMFEDSLSETEGDFLAEKPLFDKRKSIGLSDNELKRRKTLHKQHNESSYGSVEMDFFTQANAELNRIKEQRKHAIEVATLEDQVETLKRELDNKEKIITMLRRVVLEKTELVNAIGTTHIPKELLVNWSALERIFQMPSTATTSTTSS